MLPTGSDVTSEVSSPDNSEAPSKPAQAELAQALVTTRDAAGRFVKGVSGNPHGKAVTAKYQISSLQDEIELKVRNKFGAERILAVVEATFKDACGTSKTATQNRKLIFDYFMSKPKEAEQDADTSNSITIKIENATFKAQHEPEFTRTVLDGEATEVH